MVALSAPHTLVLITYTDRGHDRLFQKFVEQVHIVHYIVHCIVLDLPGARY